MLAFLVLLLGLTLAPVARGWGQVPPAAGPLQLQAEDVVAGDRDAWSAMAWSLDRRQPLFAINHRRIRVPASNNKVFTSIWALEVFGPDHRFATDLLTAGPIQAGVLRGAVILRGSGDPALGNTAFEAERLASLRPMARQLRARGVRVVEGGVIGDGSVFDTQMFGPEWPLDTGNGTAFYAPTVSGLAFQRNVLWLRVRPAPGGGPALWERDPEVPEIPVVSSARSGGTRGWAAREPGEDTIRIRGGVSGRPQRYAVGVADPAVLAAGALRQALREAGIVVHGPARRGRTPAGAKLVHRHLSVPLAQIIPKLNRDSDNFFAEHLWKAAVAHATGQGSYLRGGVAAGHFFHAGAGVPFGELWQADGSGLSRLNQASAFAMVAALEYADRRPWADSFRESLAVGGSSAGTLRGQFRGTAATGNLRAKTGYIRGVRALSGYVTTRDGERVAFSFLYNGSDTGGARTLQERLGTLIAEFSR